MFKEEQTQEQIDLLINEWWSKYILNKDSINNVEDLKLVAKYKKHDSFVCVWFSHETFDNGQTDEEFIDEFREYVSRYEHKQDYGVDEIQNDPDYECLMGAEDTWRWNSGSKEYEGIPCRCKHCKEQGMLRIAH